MSRGAAVYCGGLGLLLTFTLSVHTVFAGTGGGAFMNLPLSVRQMGLGNVSTAADDLLAAWSNPAILMAQKSEGSLALNGSSMFDGEQNTFGVGAGWLISPTVAVGGMFSGFATSISEVDEYGNATGTSVDRSVYIYGGLVSMKWRDILEAGILAKGVSDTVMDDTVNAIAADAGIVVRFSDASAGFAVRNVGADLRDVDGVGGESMPMEIRGGLAYKFAEINTTVAAEYISVNDRDGSLGLGAEYWPSRNLGIRGGVSGMNENHRQLCLGFSGVYGQMGIDYAFATHDLGSTHRVSLVFGFGKDVK